MPSMTASSRLARHGLALLVALVVLATAAPARSASEEEVAEARRQQEEAAAARAAALTDLNEAAAAYDELNTQYQDLVFRIGQMRSRIDAYEAEVRDLREEHPAAGGRGVHAGQPGGLAGGLLRERPGPAGPGGPPGAGPRRRRAGGLAGHPGVHHRRDDPPRGGAGRRRPRKPATLRLEAEAVAARMYELLAERDAELAAANAEPDRPPRRHSPNSGGKRNWRGWRPLAEEERQAAIRAALLGPAGGVPDSVTPGFICPVPPGRRCSSTPGAPLGTGAPGCTWAPT